MSLSQYLEPAAATAASSEEKAVASRQGLRPDTVITHAGRDPGAHFGAINTPVYRASTILFPTLEALDAKAKQRLRYGRRGTPSTFALEDAVSALEGAAGTVLAPSGAMAISATLLAYAAPGAHMLITDNAYGPCRHCCEEILRPMGVEITYYDPMIGGGIAELVQPNTRLVWMESPGSLTFEVQDVPAIVGALAGSEIVTVIDNTWSGGVFFKPLELGVDISIQAGTKYISGHSDVMLGTIACSARAHERMKPFCLRLGICIGADDAYLALRGLRTINVRLRQHEANALAFAQWLKGRPEVVQVMYPALPDDPHHAQWRAQFTGASGLLGFVIHETDRRKLAAMMNGLKLFGMGSSWGGYESLMVPNDPRALRTATTWESKGQNMRVHVGLEDVADLIADAGKGFDRLNGR